MTHGLFVINMIPLGRVVSFEGDKRTTVGTPVLWAMVQAGVAGSWARDGLSLSAGLGVIALTTGVLIAAEASKRWRELARFVTLLLIVGVLMSVYTADGGWVYGRLVVPAHDWLADRPAYAAYFGRVDWFRFHLYLCGALLCMDEANIATRLLLRYLKIRPPETTEPESLSDDQHGSIVGSLERLLVFIFVVNNAFNAVGFIITAKGLVKLRIIEEKIAGEYVLIGTLASTGIAIALGLWAVQWTK